jgi:hypothetical protein
MEQPCASSLYGIWMYILIGNELALPSKICFSGARGLDNLARGYFNIDISEEET